MSEFVRGWKRKIGVVTLLMALAFMGGWVRSQSVNELVFLGGRLIVISADGKFGISKEVRFSLLKKNPLRMWTGKYTANSFNPELFHQLSFDNLQGTIHFNIPMIPYLPIVVPMTLLSLWLLLSTPHKSNQKKIIALVPRNVIKVFGTFFFRWRRMTGVVTMLLALLFTGWWVRSLIVADYIYFKDFVAIDFAKYLVYPNTNRRMVGIATDGHSLVWLAYNDQKGISPEPKPYPSVTLLPVTSQSEEVGNAHPESDSTTAALPALSTTAVPLTFAVVPIGVIPFWYIITPLALVSAYLLLSKPRKSNQKKFTEPIQVEGT